MFLYFIYECLHVYIIMFMYLGAIPRGSTYLLHTHRRSNSQATSDASCTPGHAQNGRVSQKIGATGAHGSQSQNDDVHDLNLRKVSLLLLLLFQGSPVCFYLIQQKFKKSSKHCKIYKAAPARVPGSIP